MAATALPPLPPQFKSIQHHLRTAQELDKREPVVAYYCECCALHLNVFCRTFLTIKHDNNEDRAGQFHKNMIKSFYTASLLIDVLTVFGELSEENVQHRKYARWKAAYIHNCLKNGETPQPGPIGMEGETFGINGRHGSLSVSILPHMPDDSQNILPSDSENNIVILHLLLRIPFYTQNTVLHYRDVRLTPEDFARAQKYCKYAGSALQYEDVSTAVQNLQKALKLLITGRE
uniref:Vesicle trafficking 1 n=1 Tax=Pavo cristatus TaxID=9049 RepID=A0A8C9G3Q5_PAVCR